MTRNEKRARLAEIISRLEALYPDAECALEYGGDPWRLLVMARLSAQCTDARVNVVSRELFAAFPTAQDMARADLSEIEQIVKPCGLYKKKAENIRDASALLVGEYGGELPSDMDELLRFPGVGRKIANLLRGDVFGLAAVVCDTHCMRICARFGMYDGALRDPTRIERILTELLPPEKSSDFCHRIVLFGREWCSARAPRCAECPLRDLCAFSEEKK
jgi:endonuclease-3